jgi:Flp pilus assembly protein TadD
MFPEYPFALNTRADAYLSSGQLDKAVADASKAVEGDPQNAFALRTRAEAYRRQGRFNEAIRDASQSLLVEPANTYAINLIRLSQPPIQASA